MRLSLIRVFFLEPRFTQCREYPDIARAWRLGVTDTEDLLLLDNSDLTFENETSALFAINLLRLAGVKDREQLSALSDDEVLQIINQEP